MKNISVAENYAKNIVESVEEFTKDVVYELVKTAYECGSSMNDSEELQLLDVEDIEEDLQVEDYDDAIDANVFLSKLL